MIVNVDMSKFNNFNNFSKIIMYYKYKGCIKNISKKTCFKDINYMISKIYNNDLKDNMFLKKNTDLLKYFNINDIKSKNIMYKIGIIHNKNTKISIVNNIIDKRYLIKNDLKNLNEFLNTEDIDTYVKNNEYYDSCSNIIITTFIIENIIVSYLFQ